MNDTPDIARLDAIIAENDAVGTTHARWKAADAVFDKADLLEERVGPEAAAPLYEEVISRMEGATDDGQRELLICALHNLRLIHDGAGRTRESRAISERLVAEHFEDPPEDVIDIVVDNALLLSRALQAVDEDDRAFELMERIVERFGHPGIPGYVVHRCAANAGIAGLLAYHGRVDEGIQLYETVINEIQECTGLAAESVLAKALKTQALYLYRSNRIAEGEARCLELLERFSSHANDEIAQDVLAGREMLAYSRQRTGKTFRARRRSHG